MRIRGLISLEQLRQIVLIIVIVEGVYRVSYGLVFLTWDL
jgi:hypothetical protein